MRQFACWSIVHTHTSTNYVHAQNYTLIPPYCQTQKRDLREQSTANTIAGPRCSRPFRSQDQAMALPISQG